MNSASPYPKLPVVIVTGSTRGLGLAICRKLLEESFFVVGTGRAQTEGTRALISEYPKTFEFSPFDLRDMSSVREWVREVVTRHGTLFGLVNNAAVGHDGVLATMHASHIAESLRINVEAPILLAKYCSRPMLLQRNGRIVNVSSIIASTGYSGLSVYAATKAALVGFTRSLARELGKAGITVNAVAPGYMETDMTVGLDGEKLASIRRRSALGRLATVQDAASAVAYLLSPDAAGITGITLTVDAGSTA